MENLEQKVMKNKLLGTKIVNVQGSQKIVLPNGHQIEIPVGHQYVSSMAAFPDLKYGGQSTKLIVGTTSCCAGYLLEYTLAHDEKGGYRPTGKAMEIYHAPTNVNEFLPVVLQTGKDDPVTRTGYIVVGSGCNGSGVYLMGENGAFEKLVDSPNVCTSYNVLLSAKDEKVFTSVAAMRYPNALAEESTPEKPWTLNRYSGYVDVVREDLLVYNSEKAANVQPIEELLVDDLTDKLKGRINLEETIKLQSRVDRVKHRSVTTKEQEY